MPPPNRDDPSPAKARGGLILSADLTGKVALVTGASSGLGHHFAHVLSRAGATVAVAARRLDALHVLAAEISSHGGRAFPIGLNVVDNRSVRKCIDAVVGELGPIDVLVDNSGVTSNNALLDETEEQWGAGYEPERRLSRFHRGRAAFA